MTILESLTTLNQAITAHASVESMIANRRTAAAVERIEEVITANVNVPPLIEPGSPLEAFMRAPYRRPMTTEEAIRILRREVI